MNAGRACSALPIHSVPIPTLGSEILADPGLETWASATDLTNWIESIGAGSTVNREAVTLHGGTYSCRFDLSVSNGDAGITQSVALTAGKRYRFSVWYYGTDATVLFYLFVQNFATQLFLGAHGTFSDVAASYAPFYCTAAWRQAIIEFVAPSTTTYQMILYRGGPASKSIYLDDISLKEITYVSAQPDTVALYQPGSPSSVLNPIRSSQQFGPNLFTDPDLEAWTTATDLTNWIEAVGGSGSIDREATIKRNGAYSCKVTVDAPGNLTYFYKNALTLSASTQYRVSFWFKAAIGKRPEFYVLDITNSKYLAPDGSWSTIVYASPSGNGEAWTKYEQYFTTLAGATTFNFSFGGAGEAYSSSLYFDELCLQLVTQGPLAPYQSGEGVVLGTEALTNGDLESWASATDLTDWTEWLSGSATVNREATVIHGGTYAVRINCPGQYDYAYIGSANLSLTYGKRYRLSFWYRTATAKKAAILFHSGTLGKALTSDGKLLTTGAGFELPSTEGVYIKYSLEFLMTEPSATWNFYPGANYILPQVGAGVGDTYFDDLSLKEVTTLPALRPTQIQTHPTAEKLIDGGLETWASATDLNAWTESVSGASTVNREATIIHGGTYSCRFDIDSSNNLAFLYQQFSLGKGKQFRLSLWHNTPIGKTGVLRLCDDTAIQTLTSVGVWDPLAYGINLSGTGTWQNLTIIFQSHPNYNNYMLLLGGYAGCDLSSSSMYIDDVSLLELPPQGQEPIGWKFDGTDDYLANLGPSPADAFSYSIWSKRDPTGSTYDVVLHLGSLASNYPLLSTRGATIAPLAYLGSTNWKYWHATNPRDTTDGKWHHYVFVIPGIAQTALSSAVLYVDGQVQADGTIDVSGVQAARTTMTIGRASSVYAKGQFALPTLFNRVITAKEALDIYNATKGQFYPR